MSLESKVYSYIRFSNLDQKKGNSTARQAQFAKSWATKNNMTLDSSLVMTDEGLSAYSGAHRNRGSLGQFLQLVEHEKIPVGSVLIVEAIDRLSREDLWTAQE